MWQLLERFRSRSINMVMLHGHFVAENVHPADTFQDESFLFGIQQCGHQRRSEAGDAVADDSEGRGNVMTKTQYYTATSLDGFIATEDDSLDWLFPLGNVTIQATPLSLQT